MIQQISYAYFCALGGLQHPRTFTKQLWYNGVYFGTEYYLADKVNE